MKKSKTSLTTNAAQTVTPMIDQTAEVESVAGKMAETYRNMACYYRKEMGLSPEDADAKARTPAEDEYERVSNRPDRQISYWDLSLLAEQDRDSSYVIWERINQTAREELISGHRAAEAMELHGSPYQRAQFLAIRQAFIDEWQPRGGIELALIDTMAQSFQAYLAWMSVHTKHCHIEVEREALQYRETGKRKARREASLMHLEQSFQMADRFNRIFLRTLRQLRDLRRYSAPVTINNPQQVNIAADGGKQVNVAESEQQ